MSILHRRQQVMTRTATASAIPAWAELIKLEEALALAAEHGIQVDGRMPALQALNEKRKSHEDS